GPLCLVRGNLTEENLCLVAGLVVRSSKAKTLPSARVTVKLNGEERVIDSAPLDPDKAQELLVVKRKKTAIPSLSSRTGLGGGEEHTTV
ncbi:MAG: hypothetical protein QMD05_07495, partial [Candidatus Brocadiaceae bacterium]|nr:hypothetical protein [Candidatus Brocadiaceae bacterium]